MNSFKPGDLVMTIKSDLPRIHIGWIGKIINRVCKCPQPMAKFCLGIERYVVDFPHTDNPYCMPRDMLMKLEPPSVLDLDESDVEMPSNVTIKETLSVR